MTVDLNGDGEVQATFTNPSLAGFAAWFWNYEDGGIVDNMTDNSTLPNTPTLNSYGQEVAGYIAAGTGPFIP